MAESTAELVLEILCDLLAGVIDLASVPRGGDRQH